jgi:pimeloyl-ACP methyl ester carboxylesterase
MRKSLIRSTCILTMGSMLVFPTIAWAIAAPVLKNDNTSANAGDWYTGAVPANSQNKPVLLFVQGLHSNYSRWTGTDGYYEAAYNAGYRTAFVQLNDADGTGGSNWANGEILAGVIKKVAAHYNVPKINIIAHSKGGIDTQTALVHYGAASYVNVVHQLSTPNLGSELADMAYSAWTSWLASLLGQKDDAVYSLQTSYMANFRSQTDKLAANNLTKTYMSGGEGDDGIFSGTWFGHAVLPGEDDGLVSVASAMGLPYGISSFTKNISHSMMAQASQTWSLVRPKLVLSSAAKASEIAEGSAAALLPEVPFSHAQAGITESGDAIMRGGEVNGLTEMPLPLESGLANVMLQVLTAKDSTALELVSPSGKSYAPQGAAQETGAEGIFSTAVHRVFHVAQPEAGEWVLKLSGQEDAYFAQAVLETPRPTKITAGKKVLRQGEASRLQVDFGSSLKGKAHRPNEAGQGLRRSLHYFPGSEGSAIDGSLTWNFTAPSEPGVYNLSFDIEGTNALGEKVVRSVNYNYAVTDANGSIPR